MTTTEKLESIKAMCREAITREDKPDAISGYILPSMEEKFFHFEPFADALDIKHRQNWYKELRVPPSAARALLSDIRGFEQILEICSNEGAMVARQIAETRLEKIAASFPEQDATEVKK